MRGLIIKQPWIDYTFNGEKPFDIRGRAVNIRERIYKELDLHDGVELERLALVYEPHSLDRIIKGFQSIKGFIHKVNGDFTAFYSDINFYDCGL